MNDSGVHGEASTKAAESRIGTPLIVALALLSIAAVILMTFAEGWDPVAIDYGVFWRSAHRPIGEIYQARIGTHFAYPPAFILLLKPLAFVPFWLGYVFWTILSYLAFVFAAKSLTDVKTAVTATFSAACLQNLLFGQSPMLLSAALLFSLTCPSSIAGVIIGFLGTLKPQIFIMAPVVMIVRKDWRALAGMVLGGTGAILVSLAINGVQPWLDWIAALPTFGRAIIDLHVITHVITLTSIGMRLGLNPLPWWLAGTCVAIFAVLRLSRRLEGANLAALIVGASTLSVPYALPHDLVGAMPALAALILSAPSRVVFTTAMVIYIGFLLPLLLPAFAFVAAWRAPLVGPFRRSESGRSASATGQSSLVEP